MSRLIRPKVRDIPHSRLLTSVIARYEAIQLFLHMSQSINHSEFSHPRLVSIFDTVNPTESYKDFYLGILDTL